MNPERVEPIGVGARTVDWLGEASEPAGSELASAGDRRLRSPAPSNGRRESRRHTELGAEKSVLGSILIDGSALSEVLEILTADDFSTPSHVAIFRAMTDCYSRGLRPDSVSVAAALDGAVDPALLAGLVRATPNSVQAVQYARLVAEASRRRHIAEASARVVEAARGGAKGDELDDRLAALQAITARPSLGRAAVPLADYLMCQAPIHWAIPTLVVVQSMAAVVAPPESMKTFFLLQSGLACAGSGDLLGLKPDPTPFLYVSNEKSPATVRDRFRRMVDGHPPSEPVMVLHRAGVTFGRGWDLVRRTLGDFGKPAFVALDTLASLSGAGFDENSGQAMSMALAAMRGLVSDFEATVLLAHHPSKHPTEGAQGGARLRGHSSLWGEVDSVLSLHRHSREGTTGTLVADVKDGDRVVLGFEWDIETFRHRNAASRPLTVDAIRETIALIGGSASGEQIKAEFPGHTARTTERRINEAVEAGTVERIGRRGAYRYSCRSPVSLEAEWDGLEG